MNDEFKNVEARIPKNIDAEKSIISCLLQNNSLIEEVMATISYEMFYDPVYRAMFKSICELNSVGSNVDMVTLKEKVISKADGTDGKDRVEWTKIDPNNPMERIKFVKERVIEQGFDANRINDDFILDIIKHAIITTNVLDYCKIIKDKYILRNAIAASEQLIIDSRLGQKDPEVILNETQDKLFDLSKRRDLVSYVPFDNEVHTLLKEIENASKTIDGITGVRTGWKMFDGKTFGFQKGNMIVLAARPSMGKTAFALNLAHNIANKSNQRVLFFSLEMTATEILRRAISMETGISGNKLRRGNLRDDEWRELIDGIRKIHNTKIFIDTDPYLTIAEFRNKCKKFHRDAVKDGVKDIIIIDYLQYMHAGEVIKNGNAKIINSVTDEISEISKNVKAVAKELDVPIIALAQLNRELEHRNTKKTSAVPQLSDIKGSGSIEQDADIVMLINNHRDDPAATDKDVVDIIFAKNRNGEVGTHRFKFDSSVMKFYELDPIGFK